MPRPPPWLLPWEQGLVVNGSSVPTWESPRFLGCSLAYLPFSRRTYFTCSTTTMMPPQAVAVRHHAEPGDQACIPCPGQLSLRPLRFLLHHGGRVEGGLACPPSAASTPGTD